MLLGLPATRARVASNHALAWDLVSAHLGSATTFGTGSLPSRWYSFCSRDKHALDAPPIDVPELYNSYDGEVPRGLSGYSTGAPRVHRAHLLEFLALRRSSCLY